MFENYLRTAISNLRRNGLYTAVSVACLAAGICAAIVVGLYVGQDPAAGRTVLVVENIVPPGRGAPYRTYPGSPSIVPLARWRVPDIEQGVRIASAEVLVQSGHALVQEKRFAWADANALDFFRLKALAGEPETALSRPDSVAITRTFARRYFGDDRPLGRILTIRSVRQGAGSRAAPPPGPPHALRVTAVLEDLPETANLRVEAFASGQSEGSPIRQGAKPRFDPSDQVSYAFLRLRPGASAPAVQLRLNDALRDHLASAALMGSQVSLELLPVRDLHLPARRIDNAGSMTPPGNWLILEAALVVAGLVLLAACVNFAGLSTAKATQRAVEVGVRKAMGAAKGHIAAQFLFESFVQALAAVAIALSVIEIVLPLLNLPMGRIVPIDTGKAWLWLGLAGLAATVGLAAGAYPALILASFRPAAVLKGEPLRTPVRAGVREVLVTVQFAVLVVLILAVVVVYRQGEFAIRKAEQIGGRHILWVSEPGVCEGGFRDAVAKDPAVADATCASPIALQNGGAATAAMTVRGEETSIEMGTVDSRFLDFYRARLLAGRLFDDRYGSDAVLARPGATADFPAAPSVVLNATAVRKLGYSSPAQAVGKVLDWTRLEWPPGKAPAMRRGERSRIVGVVDDMQLGLNREAIRPMIYWIDPSFFSRLSLRIRTPDVVGFGKRVDDLWRSTGHAQPPRREWVDRAVRRIYADVIALDVLISICAVVALLIACAGIFALAVFTAERRRKEIGVRKALGAASADILGWLLWQFAKPVLCSVLLAWPLAWWGLAGWLSHFPDRAPMKPGLFLAATAAALLIAFLTVAGCAWTAARQKPALAIRWECPPAQPEVSAFGQSDRRATVRPSPNPLFRPRFLGAARAAILGGGLRRGGEVRCCATIWSRPCATSCATGSTPPSPSSAWRWPSRRRS